MKIPSSMDFGQFIANSLEMKIPVGLLDFMEVFWIFLPFDFTKKQWISWNLEFSQNSTPGRPGV